MTDHPPLSADDLKMVKKALRCPAKLVQGDRERQFLKETKVRLDRFGERIYLSAKQVAWLEKIASRLVGQRASTASTASTEVDHEAADELGDMPSFNELAGS
ncbi:MAG: hypothetical protein HYU74_00140 [Dechloromonas sp.]|nr:hypothetical protein [Dechloromonas sp.]